MEQYVVSFFSIKLKHYDLICENCCSKRENTTTIDGEEFLSSHRDAALLNLLIKSLSFVIPSLIGNMS